MDLETGPLYTREALIYIYIYIHTYIYIYIHTRFGIILCSLPPPVISKFLHGGKLFPESLGWGRPKAPPFSTWIASCCVLCMHCTPKTSGTWRSRHTKSLRLDSLSMLSKRSFNEHRLRFPGFQWRFARKKDPWKEWGRYH